jgi:tryptophan-rich sensory protein
MRLSYFTIPFIAVVIMTLGSLFTWSGMEWYMHILEKPAITPPKWIFSYAWSCIFAATTLAVLLIWNRAKRTPSFWLTIALFAINAVANVAWSYLFFSMHRIEWALLDAVFIVLTVYVLIILCMQRSWIAAFLLIPYAIWTTFAVYLNYLILVMNG